MEAMKKDPYKKVAKIVVDEVNSIDKLHSSLELGMRLEKMLDPLARKTFGFGCGHHCDAWGIFCGSHCLQGLDLTEEIISSRFAIDVAGKNGLTPVDTEIIQKDFAGLQMAVIASITEKLNLKNMEDRIQKFSKK
jgi:hypothetical protein